MSPLLWVLIVLVWWLLGMRSFIFWWDKQFDFSKKEYGLCFMVGFIGPLAFLVGWHIHGKDIKQGIIFKGEIR